MAKRNKGPVGCRGEEKEEEEEKEKRKQVSGCREDGVNQGADREATPY